MIEVKCKGCEKTWLDYPANIKFKTGKVWCSRECFKKHTTVIKPCPTCGKMFTVWKSRSFITYCSKKCEGISKRRHAVIDHNGTLYYKTTPGYYVSRPKGKHGIMLHRTIYEETYNVKLEKHNTIHHKNGIRIDNRPENLELWTTRHPKGIRVNDL